jgi:hypothetical protein
MQLALSCAIKRESRYGANLGRLIDLDGKARRFGICSSMAKHVL